MPKKPLASENTRFNEDQDAAAEENQTELEGFDIESNADAM